MHKHTQDRNKIVSNCGLGGLKIGLPSVFTIPSRESNVLLLYSATIMPQTRETIKYPFLLIPQNQENLHLNKTFIQIEIHMETDFNARFEILSV